MGEELHSDQQPNNRRKAHPWGAVCLWSIPRTPEWT